MSGQTREYWHPLIELGLVVFIAGFWAVVLLSGTIALSIAYFKLFGA